MEPIYVTYGESPFGEMIDCGLQPAGDSSGLEPWNMENVWLGAHVCRYVYETSARVMTGAGQLP